MAIYMWREPSYITTAWIYRNETEGLISLSSDGSNWLTIADKNLWATTAWTTSESYWNYYCWWWVSDCRWTVTSSYTYTDNWANWTYTICPSWFYIPTRTDLTGLLSLYQTITWKTTSADFQSDLMLPLAWQKQAANTTITYAWTWWYLWTKETTWSNWYFFRIANLNTWNTAMWTWFSVRPFKTNAVQPDDTWTAIYNIQLKSLSELTAMTSSEATAELNSHATEYYNKFSAEWQLYYVSFSWYYFLSNNGAQSWLIVRGDWYSIWYNSQNVWEATV